jgi:hypothetical protein
VSNAYDRRECHEISLFPLHRAPGKSSNAHVSEQPFPYSLRLVLIPNRGWSIIKPLLDFPDIPHWHHPFKDIVLDYPLITRRLLSGRRRTQHLMISHLISQAPRSKGKRT